MDAAEATHRDTLCIGGGITHPTVTLHLILTMNGSKALPSLVHVRSRMLLPSAGHLHQKHPLFLLTGTSLLGLCMVCCLFHFYTNNNYMVWLATPLCPCFKFFYHVQRPT